MGPGLGLLKADCIIVPFLKQINISDCHICCNGHYTPLDDDCTDLRSLFSSSCAVEFRSSCAVEFTDRQTDRQTEKGRGKETANMPMPI